MPGKFILGGHEKSEGMSDDFGRYVQMGLKMEPKNPIFLSRKE